jgi:hypothetical protein
MRASFTAKCFSGTLRSVRTQPDSHRKRKAMHLEHIRCSDIHPDPASDRTNPADLATLADSIRVNGVLRPILLCEAPGGYVIVHGERRWRAAQMAGLGTIPAMIVQDFGDRSSAARIDLRHPQHPGAMASGLSELATADD